MDARNKEISSEQIHQELRTETEEENEQEEEIGIDVYPPDFWYVLSQYIRPEDVGRFAGICRKAYNAVNCASFWFNLYKRYYRKVIDMPRPLQPEHMTGLYGLRLKVIRSLRYTYTPFVLSSFLTDYRSYKFLSDVQRKKLITRVCRSAWKDIDGTISFILAIQDRISRSKISDTIVDQGDIFVNDAEDCIRLQIDTWRPFMTASILNGVLTNIVYDGNKLVMNFSTGVSSSEDNRTVEFESISKIYIHNWWSPCYPHSY